MKTFKVLAIDGGGIKGLYSAKILNLIEERLQQEYGEATRIVDYTDMICGTSTGGLIALGLSRRIPTKKICELYELNGPEIFAKSQSIFALLRQTLFGGKFSDRRLKAALQEMFQDSTIGDSHCLLCVPTYNFTQGGYEVFKFDHKEGGLSRHNSLPIVDVALATSAAPTFFPLAQIEKDNNNQYVDGGVWANNPSLVGFLEAAWYFVGQGKAYDHLNLLSVASLNFGSGKPPLLKRNRSFIRWAPDLFDLSLVAQSEFADTFLRQMQLNNIFPLSYTRIPSSQIGYEQTQYIKLDLATLRSITLIKQFATNMYYEYRSVPTVQTFFSEKKTYYV